MTLEGIIYDVQWVACTVWRVRVAAQDKMTNKRIIGEFLVERKVTADHMKSNTGCGCVATVDEFGYLNTFRWID
jgi:hypothetical protein